MGKTQVNMTPAELNEKWGRRSKQATPDIVRGILAVTESPTKKAAAAKDKYLAGIQNNAGKWANALNAVTLEDWKEKAATKTQARHAAGVDAGMPAHRKFAEYLIPTVNAGMAKVAGMPSMDLNDSKARASAWMDHMANNRYKK